jgi:hypothetical protein
MQPGSGIGHFEVLGLWDAEGTRKADDTFTSAGESVPQPADRSA